MTPETFTSSQTQTQQPTPKQGGARTTWVLGNWKMNPESKHEAVSLATELASRLTQAASLTQSIQSGRLRLGVAPTLLHLGAVKSALGSHGVWVLSQDTSGHEASSGAYTGDISASMLKDAGAQASLVGHSERRTHHLESTPILIRKATRLLAQGLTVIFCVGESKAQRDAGKAYAVVSEQLTDVIQPLLKSSRKSGSMINATNLVIAYEPVWAIGTGLSASSDDAQSMHAHIRSTLTQLDESLAGISLLYGGSVKPANASSFAACQDVDGVLVGGASLNTQDFLDIVLSFG